MNKTWKGRCDSSMPEPFKVPLKSLVAQSPNTWPLFSFHISRSFVHTYEHSSLTSNLPPHPLKGALHQDSDAHIVRRQTLVEDPGGPLRAQIPGYWKLWVRSTGWARSKRPHEPLSHEYVYGWGPNWGPLTNRVREQRTLLTDPESDTGHSATLWVNANTGLSLEFSTKYFAISNFQEIANVLSASLMCTLHLLLNPPKSRFHPSGMFFTFTYAVPLAANGPTLPPSPPLTVLGNYLL